MIGGVRNTSFMPACTLMWRASRRRARRCRCGNDLRSNLYRARRVVRRGEPGPEDRFARRMDDARRAVLARWKRAGASAQKRLDGQTRHQRVHPVQAKESLHEVEALPRTVNGTGHPRRRAAASTPRGSCQPIG